MRANYLLLSIMFLGLFGRHIEAIPVQAQNSESASIIAWSPDGDKMAVVFTNTILVVNTDDWTIIGDYTGHSQSEYVTTVVWSPSGSHVVSGDASAHIHIWETADFTASLIIDNVFLSEFARPVQSLDWSPDESMIAGSFADSRTIVIWDTFAGEIRHRFDFPQPSIGPTVRFSPVTSLLAVSEHSGFLIWDMNTESTLFNPMEEFDQEYSSNVLEWSADGTKLITGGLRGEFSLWNTENWQLIHATPREASVNIVVDIAWSPIDEQMISLNQNGVIQFWNIPEFTLETSYQASPLTRSISFSAYSGRLAIGGKVAGVNIITSFVSDENQSYTILVPIATAERFAEIAAFCNAPASLTALAEDAWLMTQSEESQGRALLAQLDRLAEGAIPVGCEADLRAIAGAMGG